jgi:predicted SAM-dependent methyltransferase
MKKLRNEFNYFFKTSYRRKLLDNLLVENKDYFRKRVLDIGGGRKRGLFRPPNNSEWFYGDIQKEFSPDIVVDVQNMISIKDNSFDSIKATELFEHVEFPEKGISECYRILKKSGHMIISVPFLCPIHADPYDFQRWTETKWKKELKKRGFKIVKLQRMGLFFTVIADMIKIFFKSLPFGIKHIVYIFYPILDVLCWLDNLDFVKINEKLNKYTTGYFIITRK